MIDATLHAAALESFIANAMALLDGANQAGFDRLGARVEEEMRGYVDHGGMGHKSGRREPSGPIHNQVWPKTHKRWVELRGKTHDTPLYNTGHFRSCFTHYVEGRSIHVGNTFIGARRFDLGDQKIYGGPGPRFRAPFFDKDGNPREMTVSVKIQERPFRVLWQSDVDAWWEEMRGMLHA